MNWMRCGGDDFFGRPGPDRVYQAPRAADRIIAGEKCGKLISSFFSVMGWKPAQIAAELGISVKTVSNQKLTAEQVITRCAEGSSARGAPPPGDPVRTVLLKKI